ncbi:hypothetical protein BH24ACT4_BH24ACT4_07380 [soil metagenome]
MPPPTCPRRQPRRPVAALAAVALALVLGLSACSVGQPPAATVNGADISADRVDEIVEAYVSADAETYGQFDGVGDDTLSMDPVTNVLSSLIGQVLQSELAAERDAVPTEEERTQAEEEIRTSFVQEETPAAEGETSPSDAINTEIFESLSQDTRDYLIDLRADALALTRVVGEETGSTDEAARAYYDENPELFRVLCLRLLAVAEPDLPAIQDRLDADEDFGEVSAEVSIDPQIVESVQGPPQCTAIGQLQQQLEPTAFGELAAGAEGDVVGPFAYDAEGNVVLVELQAVQTTPFEEVRDLLLQQLPSAGDQAVAALIESEVPEADVSVDPRFGTWSPEQGIVVPPDGADQPAPSAEDLPPVEIEGVDPTDPPG